MSERIDQMGFGKLCLIQDSDEFCYGVDAVILADFAAKTAKKKRAICDLGTGTGAIPLILSHKTEAERLTGIEVQKNSYELALRNVEMNGLSKRVEIMNLNVKDIKERDCYDVVTCNPPYAEGGKALLSSLDAKAIARHEILGDLKDFMNAAARLLKDRGELFMVHRPSRLVDIMCIGRELRLEPKTLRMVCPREGEAANIVLVHFIKGAGRELKVLPDLYVYGENGTYSDEIQSIYERE